MYRESTPPLRLVRREGEGRQTRFTFQVPDSVEVGEDLVIAFAMQDLSTGESVVKERRLQVVPPPEETPRIDLSSLPAPEPSDSAVPEGAGERDSDGRALSLEAAPSAGDALRNERADVQGSSGSDQALSDHELYRKARLYESPGPERDLVRARRLYAELLRDHPLSDHWDDAKVRLEFLERHFFHLR
ncbi:hypothetical protein SAMN05920897_12010 [Alkalispirochaeta americana]|uniref:Uncharacterized protein n=1 Tax=Alkalispirochaeta americana TaxID=159291 RepID=A0A1N6X3F1_9SPIO|nr:hypothetical protein [Alkalispirochaeta americana]SIQ96781.1 hypothetical protein SAMN05920897_12010 [Alkalispirochaeta americana]